MCRIKKHLVKKSIYSTVEAKGSSSGRKIVSKKKQQQQENRDGDSYSSALYGRVVAGDPAAAVGAAVGVPAAPTSLSCPVKKAHPRRSGSRHLRGRL